jgi:hypothetical protein
VTLVIVQDSLFGSTKPMQVKGGMGIVLIKDKILHVLLKHGWKEVLGDFLKERCHA